MDNSSFLQKLEFPFKHLLGWGLSEAQCAASASLNKGPGCSWRTLPFIPRSSGLAFHHGFGIYGEKCAGPKCMDEEVECGLGEWMFFKDSHISYILHLGAKIFAARIQQQCPH